MGGNFYTHSNLGQELNFFTQPLMEGQKENQCTVIECLTPHEWKPHNSKVSTVFNHYIIRSLSSSSLAYHIHNKNEFYISINIIVLLLIKFEKIANQHTYKTYALNIEAQRKYFSCTQYFLSHIPEIFIKQNVYMVYISGSSYNCVH